MKKIIVKNARMHNLKNIDVEFPRDKLIVVTGLSGSGKSSLAFDTIYAEGQRRYVESLSTYARQFLSMMEKPDVDSISGLSPAIAIDQKSSGRNPRSTVGTVTEIYDYFRLLFSKIGHPHCPKCKKEITHQSRSQIIDSISALPEGKRVLLLAPLIVDRKGEHIKVFEKIKRDGFVRMRIDGDIYTIADTIKLDAQKKHTIEVVVDRLVIKDFSPIETVLSDGQKIVKTNPDRTRLADSIETALKTGEGRMTILDNETSEETVFSEEYSCIDCGISVAEIEPRSFSFNSPHGACPKCHGLGTMLVVQAGRVMPNPRLTINEGAIYPWSNSTARSGWYTRILEKVAKSNGFSLDTRIGSLTFEQKNIIMYGTGDEEYTIKMKDGGKSAVEYSTKYEGVVPNLQRRYLDADTDQARQQIEKYMDEEVCSHCEGKRLRPEILAVTLGERNIIDVTEMSIEESKIFFENFQTEGHLTENEQKIGRLIFQEIISRLSFLMDVGLSYLTLNRSAATLSGGEAQRIRLATQIGSALQGVLYVLDEPSIGLHQRDNDRLITTLRNLQKLGNTVLVVEHDEDTIRAADYLLEIGPGAGKHGGEVVASGTYQEVLENKNSITADYLSGRKKIDVPKKRRKGNKLFLEVLGANAHNLKNVDVKIPLGCLVGVTGVSGSGKSTLINQVLSPELARELNGAHSKGLSHREINGINNLDKIIHIDQNAIGRTPRSNCATYTGVFTDIRDLFASMPEAKMRGYNAGRFSFNVKGGRCEACHGDGLKKIEMHFLPDIYVSCEECHGKRYNAEALEITWKGHNIADVLVMTVSEAYIEFKAIPSIANKLSVLEKVGLGYIHLGQSATTLSGGEAQRIKLSTELSKRSTGKTLYVLDEPTTGLHFDDVKRLLSVLQELVDRGNSMIVIEHNLDVIKSCDFLLDIGPEGGKDGGEIVATGTPEDVAKVSKSYTGAWLKKVLKAD